MSPPGTLTEDSLLDARRHNFLAAYAEIRDAGALAWGRYFHGPSAGHALHPRTAWAGTGGGWPRARVLLADPMAEALRPVIEDMGAALTALAPASFDSWSGRAGR